MSERDPSHAPERLLQGKYGALLRQANREFEAGLDQPAAFRRVEERLATSRRERVGFPRRWLITAAPFAVAAAAGIFVLARGLGGEVAPELVAEPSRPPLVVSSSPSVVTASTSSMVEDPTPRAERKREPRSAKPRVDARIEPSSEPLPALPPPVPSSSAAAVSEPAPAPDCLSLAHRGQTRAAESCFLERAQGTGLAAEMALYELSRLRRDVLADAEGALRALEDYKARFSGGSLRREVDMSQRELLLQLGRSDDALKRSDELLSSSTSGERAGELRLLRGHILRKQSRFAEAVREYELAEAARSRGAEALYFRALCLEALGRRAEAGAAFSQYLEQPHKPYAEDAKRRLEKLKP